MLDAATVLELETVVLEVVLATATTGVTMVFVVVEEDAIVLLVACRVLNDVEDEEEEDPLEMTFAPHTPLLVVAATIELFM